MTTEQTKEVIRRYINIWNGGDLSAFDEVLDDNFVYRGSGGTEYRGLQENKEAFQAVRNAFPDLELSLENIVAEGNQVSYFYRMQGTFENDYKGIPATNEKIDHPAAAFCTVEDGKITEQIDTYDQLEYLTQMGVLPEDLLSGEEETTTEEEQRRS